MKHECIVMIPAQQQEIRQGMLLYKKEWADILTTSETIQENGISAYYKTNGKLVEVNGGQAIVKLKNGILISIPLYCVQLCVRTAAGKCGV